MKDYEEELENANKTYKIADHMLYVTYPLLKEERILLSVTENLLKSINHSITAILQYERNHGRIPAFPKQLSAKLNTFRMKVMKRHNITNEEFKFINNLLEIQEEHKKSSMEFVRKGKMVMLSPTQSIRTITRDEIAKLAEQTKKFNQKIASTVKQE